MADISYVVPVVEHKGSILLGRKAQQVRWGFLHEQVGEFEQDETAVHRATRRYFGTLVHVDHFIGETYLEGGEQQRWYRCSSLIPQTIPAEEHVLEWVPRKDVLSYVCSEVQDVMSEEVRSYFINE